MARQSPEQIATERIEAARRSGARELSLSNLGLTALPEAIAGLTALETLYLNGNQLTGFPDAIAGLSALERLALNGNQLTALPDAFAGLSALRILRLEGNQLTALPDAITGLTALKILNLEGNQLTALPDAIAGLPALRELFLHDNDALGIPPEILGPMFAYVDVDHPAASPADILNYYFRARQEATRPLNEAKIILVGQGGVGKTSLVRRLVHGDFDPEEEKTEGIDILPWSLAMADGGEPVQLNIWDFGGQEIMHATHRFFLTNRSLYLLVLDTRKGENESNIQYWLEIIQSYGGNSPVIIVLNKSDEHALALNETRLMADHEANLRAFVPTSARTGEGVDALKAAVAEQLGQLGHIHDAVPESYFRVKEQLQALSAENDFVGNEKFNELCAAHGVKEAGEQQTLLRFLHDLGNVLNYGDPDDPYRLGDTNILNPEWVTGGVYKILNDRDLLLASGDLDREAVQRILGADPRYPAERHDFILGMMRKFELCFDFPDAGDGRLLVPELLHPNEIPLDWDFGQTLNFQYNYNVLPGGILPRFIVRMHHALADWRNCWRSGVVLRIEANPVVVRADSHANRIHVAVDGPMPGRRGALAVVREYFKAIHASVPGLTVKEMVPLPDARETAVGYQHLLTLEDDGQPDYWPEGAPRRYTLAELLNGIEDPEQRREERERQREFEGRGERLAERAAKRQVAEKAEAPAAGTKSPLLTVAGLVALVIVLMAAVVWLANQVGENAATVSVLGGITILAIYLLYLFVAHSANRIDQKTFSKLSLGVLNKLPALNSPETNGDD